MPNQRSTSNGSRTTKKRPPVFPKRLYDMLENAERDGYAHIISWMPEGMSFKIHVDGSLDEDDEKAIVAILKRTFNQTRFKSFLRQLQLYGFDRTYKGPHRGECKHELFIRGRRDLLHKKSIEDFQRKANDTSNRRPKGVRNIFKPAQLPSKVESSFTMRSNPTNGRFLFPTTCSASTSINRYAETSVIPTKLTNLILPDSDSSSQADQRHDCEYDDDDLSLVIGNPLVSTKPVFDSTHMKSIDMVHAYCQYDDDVISIHRGANVPCWTGMELDILRHAL